MPDFGNVIDVRDHRLVGDPNYFAAFNRSAALANSATEPSGIWFPAGTYDLSNLGPLDLIIRNDITIFGDGDCSKVILPADARGFQFGGDTVETIEGGGIRDLQIFYPDASDDATLAIGIANAARLRFQNIRFEGANVIAQLGSEAAFPVNDIMFSHLTGYVGNYGHPCFGLVFGAGFRLYNSSLYVVGVDYQSNPSVPLNVVVGRRLVAVLENSWDTIVLGGSQIFQRFDSILYCVAGEGNVIYGIVLEDFICDVCNNSVTMVARNGGIISTFKIGGYYTGWSGNAIRLETDVSTHPASTIAAGQIDHARCFFTLNEGIYIGKGVIDVDITAPQIYANNYANNGSAAINFADGVTRFTLIGGRVGWANTALGFNSQAAYGVRIGIDCDDYQLSVQAEGSVQPWLVSANSVGSKTRRITSVARNNYAGIQSGTAWTLPASGMSWTNTTPLRCRSC